MRSLLFAALLATLAAPACLGQDENGYYDQDELGGSADISPAELEALGEVTAVYAEIGEIRRRGNADEEVAQHRSYRLVPALRDIARKAADLGSPVLLGKAVELASCESNPQRSYEWTDVFAKAANKFSENDFRAAVESLPDANRRSFKAAVAGNLPASFKWKDVVCDLSTWEDDDGGFVEQEQEP